MEKEYQMEERKSNTGTFLLGTMIGGLIGGLAALLTAPRPGKETQQIISAKKDELVTEAEKRIDEGRQLTVEKYGEIRSTVADWLATGSEMLTEKSREMKIESTKKPKIEENVTYSS